MSADLFVSTTPTAEVCWRGVVLYGRNTASYKFALATALLDLQPRSGELVKIEVGCWHSHLSHCEHL